jgi:hypothetical protein
MKVKVINIMNRLIFTYFINESLFICDNLNIK